MKLDLVIMILRQYAMTVRVFHLLTRLLAFQRVNSHRRSLFQLNHERRNMMLTFNDRRFRYLKGPNIG